MQMKNERVENMKMKGNKKEKFDQVYRSFEPLRDAKSITIHALAGYGKKYRALRYPILAFLFVFLFLYNAILYTLIHFRVHEKPAKLISGALVLCLIVNSVYIPALAFDGAGDSQSGVVCENHTSHDENCGYVEAVAAQPCTHVHGDECYSTNTACVHVHDEGCYDTDGELVCTHVCSEESGCITRVLNCGHIHDENCGYEIGRAHV